MYCFPQYVSESFKSLKKREFKSKHVAAHSDSRLYCLIEIIALRLILIPSNQPIEQTNKKQEVEEPSNQTNETTKQPTNQRINQIIKNQLTN